VTSVMVGSADVTNQAVLLSPATREIQVIVKAGGTIRGTVHKCNGGTVLLVPSSMVAGDVGGSHSCNPDGSFEFAGLPPGDYYR